MKTCLVVDDSSVIRKIARRILEEMDFQIIEAEDGEQALEACKRAMPTAVLLDWNMPSWMATNSCVICAVCPAAMCPRSCSAPPKTTSHTLRARCMPAPNEYIMKPFDKDIVTAKFQEVGLIELHGTEPGLNLIRLPLRGSREPARL
jgi:two-component system chemotaxis response regulator CheY